MCGIGILFCRESVPPYSDVIDPLFRWGEKRGSDGTGYAIIKPSVGKVIINKYVETYSELRKVTYVETAFWPGTLKVGDIILTISRAAPETEPATTKRDMQPIKNEDCVLVHNGAVSQKIVDELRNWALKTKRFYFETSIDSEAIIAEYIRCERDMKLTMESLSGGFAFIMVDMKKKCIYLVNDFKPLAISYVRGVGFFAASDEKCLREIVSNLTGCSRDGMNIWESHYAHWQKGYTIREVDIDSGMERVQKFSPRFITSTWDSSKSSNGKEAVLVAASGGLDSTVTLAVLKKSGYENIYPVHFNYGHRGQDAEEIAFVRVIDKLGLETRKIFNIEEIMNSIDDFSMLTDKDAEVRTGTSIALKTTEAWVCSRNSIFLTLMTAYAESLVMQNGFKKVYLTGGFMNLTESGVYPDNSEYFLNSFLEHAKYGTLIGDRLEPLYCLSNIMKSEQWLLIKHLDLWDVIKDTISCDRPIIGSQGIESMEFKAYNCAKDGSPACGSGLLSWWAAKMAGVEDNRKFYEIEGEYEPYVPEHLKSGEKRNLDINNIVERILIPEDKKENLRKAIINA